MWLETNIGRVLLGRRFLDGSLRLDDDGGARYEELRRPNIYAVPSHTQHILNYPSHSLRINCLHVKLTRKNSSMGINPVRGPTLGFSCGIFQLACRVCFGKGLQKMLSTQDGDFAAMLETTCDCLAKILHASPR